MAYCNDGTVIGTGRVAKLVGIADGAALGFDPPSLQEARLLIDGAGGGARRTPDHSLCRILAQSYRYNEMVMRNDGKTIAELAAEAGVGGSYLSRILRLSFLAPDVVKAILRDRHPIELTAKRLAYRTRLPIAWDEQRALRGID